MESNQPYDLQLLWDHTNYGLNYFHEVYPESIGKENKNKHFFCADIHAEKTPSFTLSNKSKNGDQKFRIRNHATSESFNMIDHVIKTTPITEFIEAVKYLFEKYGLAFGKSAMHNPEKEFKQSDKEPGTWAITAKKKLENQSVFAPFLKENQIIDYGFVELESYEKHFINSVTKEPTCLLVKALPTYPIFAYNEHTDFAKIYEPKAVKSSTQNYKHHFLGKKPERPIYGWAKLMESVDIKDIEFWMEKLEEAKAMGSTTKIKEALKELSDLRVDKVFIATGGSDAFNIISLGYEYVIWFNSEAEKINFEEYSILKKIANFIYYVPDNDTTGINAAVSIGMQFMDIKIVWLPKMVDEYASNQPIKDVRDYVTKLKGKGFDYVRNGFATLVMQALEFKFWKFANKGYKIDELCLLNFLKHSGYHVYTMFASNPNDPLSKKENVLVYVQKNIATMVQDRDVREFVINWAIKKGLKRDIVNLIIRTPLFNELNLFKLPSIEIDFVNWTASSQVYMFKNKFVVVSKNDGVKELPQHQAQAIFWDKKVIQHDFNLLEPFFKITNENNQFDIEILNKECNLLKVFINTSRMYWRLDADENEKDTNPFGLTSQKLTEEQNHEQKLHLINKIFVLGYLMHRYNGVSTSWNVLGTDNTIGKTIKQSNGGSGKSFLLECLRIFHRNTITIDGTALNSTDAMKFAFDQINIDTDFVIMDDLDMYFPHRSLYAKTTGDFVANHKGKTVRILQKFKPKIACTTNFVPFDLDAAATRRQLNYQTSSYYHAKTDDYKFERRIFDDFGMNLLDEHYPAVKFNQDYNFLLQCLNFYLNCTVKINAPGDSISVRNLNQKIGQNVLDFLDKFFQDPEVFSKPIEKSKFFPMFEEEFGKQKNMSKNAFNEKVKMYCGVKHIDTVTNTEFFINMTEKKTRPEFSQNPVPHFFFEKVDEKQYVPPTVDVIEFDESNAPETPSVYEDINDMPF